MKYTESHEWVKVADGEVTIGITAYGQEELGDIVYVELPSIGTEVKAGDEAVVLESTKAAADLYVPVSGTIVATNESVKKDPSLLNTHPENEGWLFKLQLKDKAELDKLLSEEAYRSMLS